MLVERHSRGPNSEERRPHSLLQAVSKVHNSLLVKVICLPLVSKVVSSKVVVLLLLSVVRPPHPSEPVWEEV